MLLNKKGRYDLSNGARFFDKILNKETKIDLVAFHRTMGLSLFESDRVFCAIKL